MFHRLAVLGAVLGLIAVMALGSGQASAGTYTATDAASLSAGLAALESGAADTLVLEGAITGSGFVLQVNRPVTIQGGTINRTSFAAAALTIANSIGVTLRGISFTDDQGSVCNPIDFLGACTSQLLLVNSSPVVLDGLHFTGARSNAITTSYSIAPDVTIHNSVFANVGAFGLWSYNTASGGRFRITDNTFTNGGSSAIALAVASAEGTPSVISGNLFSHNHHVSLYNLCGAGANEPCGGGQLYIYTRGGMPATSNVVITGNAFEDGYIENCVDSACFFGVPGIELDQYGLSRISETENVYRRSSAGVLVNLQPNTGGFALSSKLLTAFGIFDTVPQPRWQVGLAPLTVVE